MKRGFECFLYFLTSRFHLLSLKSINLITNIPKLFHFPEKCYSCVVRVSWCLFIEKPSEVRNAKGYLE